MSILNAGTGPILDSENDNDADMESECLASIRRAASRTDWRAAAWLLERHPLTRERFSDAARDQALYARHAASTCRGIDRWAAAEQIPPPIVSALVLHLQAAGTAALDELPEAHG